MMYKDDEKFMVYVSCMTFNHANYIKDALDGFCMQQTEFPYVCGIIDDASTDGEPELIKNYLEENFEFGDESICGIEETDDYTRIFTRHKTNKNCYFVVVFLKYNHYQAKKSKWQYVAEWRESVKYYAPCEGDDYWEDPLKLQKQVNYMEEHPRCNLCYASARIYNQDSNTYENSNIGAGCDSFESLLKRSVIPTLTVLYRSSAKVGYEEEINPSSHKWSLGDYPLWLWLALKGDIHYFNEQMGVYRKLEGSASHPTSADKYIKLINDANDIAILFDQKYNQGKLTKYREYIRYRGLMSIEANFNHSFSGVCSCFSKMPQKTINDAAYLCKLFFQICYYRLFKHKK